MDGRGPFFEKITVAGVGLIGASFAMAVRRNGLAAAVSGYGRNAGNLKRAADRGIIDTFSVDPAEACRDCDLLFLSAPVGAFTSIINDMKGALKRGCLVTDAGSVKGGLVEELESLVPDGVRFIGAHPIAGGEKSGIDDARADLFRGARCIITPTERSDREALDMVISLWRHVDAVTEIMDPHRHDAVFGLMSHLPHVVAYALVNTVGAVDEEMIGYAGQGFRDTTRIAMSSPELWRDIVLHNGANILRAADTFRDCLDRIIGALRENDPSLMEREFRKAQELRKRLS